MKKNKILILTMSLALLFFYGCANSSGPDTSYSSSPSSSADSSTPEKQSDSADTSNPEKKPDSTDPSTPEKQPEPEKPSVPETGSITITEKEGNDLVINKTESNGIVTLTAAEGYSDYKWYLDASSAVVSENATYSFTPSEGYTMVFVTAKKNGVTYSATYYISLKK